MIEEGYYTAAEKLVDKLLESDPESANFNYRKGFILSQAYQNYKGAVPYLEKAVKDVDKNYDLYSASEPSASVDAIYYLGKSYHRLNRLEDARAQYQAFLANSNKKSPLVAHAELGLTQLDNAVRMQETPKRNVKVVNLGTIVNSQYPEYSPVISFDGSALFYTSRKKWDEGQNESSIDQQYGLYPEDIYVSYKDFDESWTEPMRLDFCDPDQNEASISVSMDERRIYVYQDIVGNGDIFYSDFTTNRFKDIKPFDNKDVNTDFWDTHCNVTPDGRTMYFTSERPGGFGGRDIYRIVKMPDGTWSKPFNLGPSINTAFDEDAPFMASDNKSLFYASNGTKSMGGFDIMMSVIDQDNNWSDPVNLGWPLNSTQDDVFYTETIDGRRGYITSMRDDTKGEKDIYEIHNDYMSVDRGAILKGKIIVLNGKPLPESLVVTVECKDCNPAFARTVYPRLRDGMFMMSLEPCREYEVSFAKTEGGEEFFRETIRTDCKKEKEEIYREAFLNIDGDDWKIVNPKDTVKPADTIPASFEPLAFRHTFDYNKNKLTMNSSGLKEFIADVEKQLSAGRKDIYIGIYSSASYVPTKTFKNNEELSRTRAENLQRQLEEYFGKSKYANQVKIGIASTVVSGPAYEKDPKNKDKYRPFQFVELKTN